MIRNHFIIAIRNLLKHKLLTFIHVLGLAIGISACTLILLYIKDEWSYDRYPAKSERIYRVEGYYARGGEGMEASASSNFGLAPFLKAAFPEIEEYVRLSIEAKPVKHLDKVWMEERVCYADSAFFDVFSCSFIKGRANVALSGPNQLVITETCAKKYFGAADPMGQMLTVDEIPVQVTGVIKEMPRQSHFHADLFISVSTVANSYPKWMTDPSTCGTSHYTYLVLPANYSSLRIESRLEHFVSTYIGKDHSNYMRLTLQPLQKIHLYSHSADALEPGGDMLYLYIFGTVAFIILLVAGLNYVNLTTARSVERAREIGLRKVTGASRRQLIFQFLGESILISFISLILSCFLTAMSLPLFNHLSGKGLPSDLLLSPNLLLCLLVGSFLLGAFAGIYPAFFLSSFGITEVLKGSYGRDGRGSARLRKVLITSQLCISIILIISVLLIYSQMQFIQNKKLGITPAGLFTVLMSQNAAEHYETIKAQLLGNHAIQAITCTNNDLSSGSTNWKQYQWENNSRNDVSIATMDVDDDFAKTLEAEVIAGRWFSKDYPADTADSFIINESAAKFLGLKHPVNAPLLGSQFNGANFSQKKGRIIGVVKDFHFASLRQEVKPVVFNMKYSKTGLPVFMWVRVQNGQAAEALQFIKHTWKKFDPGYPVHYSLLEEDITNLYAPDQNFLKITGVFACLALFIACLGIFGLCTYTVHRRAKEIGIRKAIGASATSIVLLISKDFAKLVLLSFLVAAPVAWYLMQRWLQNYAYKVDISSEAFILSGLLITFITSLSISYQSLKAARMNPVKTLRTD